MADKFVLQMTGPEILDALTRAQQAVTYMPDSPVNNPEQARRNIGAMKEGKKIVLYSEQTLTDEEKAQARANIGFDDDTEDALATSWESVRDIEKTLTGKIDCTSVQDLSKDQKRVAQANLGFDIIEKNSEMNSPVGIDEDGRLWAYDYRFEAIENAQSLQELVRGGRADEIFTPGDDSIEVDRAIDVTVLTAANNRLNDKVVVDSGNFVTGIDNASSNTYSFEYRGDVVGWLLNEEIVIGATENLLNYGISLLIEPQSGDSFYIHVTSIIEKIQIIDLDYDAPADKDKKHSLTVAPLNVLNNNFTFNSPEALVVFPEGLPKGVYYLHLKNSGAENNFYNFDILKDIPPQGALRYVTLGINGGEAGVLKTYDENRNPLETTALSFYSPQDQEEEDELPTRYNCLGTFGYNESASNGNCIVKTNCNNIRRSTYSTPEWYYATIRQMLNSTETNWWKYQAGNPWQVNPESPLSGYLAGLDPEFVRSLGLVTKRTLKYNENGEPDNYEDSTQRVFLPSVTELNFTKQFDADIAAMEEETSYDSEGNIQKRPYALFEKTPFARNKTITESVYAPYWTRSIYFNKGQADQISVFEVPATEEVVPNRKTTIQNSGLVPFMCIV